MFASLSSQSVFLDRQSVNKLNNRFNTRSGLFNVLELCTITIA